MPKKKLIKSTKKGLATAKKKEKASKKLSIPNQFLQAPIKATAEGIAAAKKKASKKKKAKKKRKSI